MSQAIIYQNDHGGISIALPAPEAIAQLGLEVIARKDVPAGKLYKIVDATEIPEDRTFRDAWEVDASALTDGIGADYGVGSKWDIVGFTDTMVVVRHADNGEIKEVLK